MNHDIRIRRFKRGTQCGNVANIAEPMVDVICDPRHHEQILFAFRRKRKTMNFGAKGTQQERQPGALNPVCPVRNTLRPRQKAGSNHQILHSAFPLVHCDSRKVLSRMVSIGCQKP